MKTCCKCGKIKKINVQNSTTMDYQMDYYNGTDIMISDLKHVNFVNGLEVSFKKLSTSLVVKDGKWVKNTSENISSMNSLPLRFKHIVNAESDPFSGFINFLEPNMWVKDDENVSYVIPKQNMLTFFNLDNFNMSKIKNTTEFDWNINFKYIGDLGTLFSVNYEIYEEGNRENGNIYPGSITSGGDFEYNLLPIIVPSNRILLIWILFHLQDFQRVIVEVDSA